MKGNGKGQFQYWIVLWPASYGNFPVGELYWAASTKGAISQAQQKTEYGQLSGTSDQLFAVPAGPDHDAAVKQYQQLAEEAEAGQAAALMA